jgi:hypothetical protein
MYTDVSGPMSDMLIGTTTTTHVANYDPAGERPNKTPTFSSGVDDTRAFLAGLRASCHDGLTVHLKGDGLMVIPSNANGFRAASQRSAVPLLEGGCDVSHLLASGGPCVRLLVKILGRRIPESVFQEELDPWTFVPRESCSSEPATVTRTPLSTVPLPSIQSVARWPRMSRVRSRTYSAVSKSQWNRTWRQRTLLNASAESASVTRSVMADTHHCASRADSHLSMGARPLGDSPCCTFGGNHKVNYRRYVKWGEAKAALTQQAPEWGRNSTATGKPAAPNTKRARPSAEQDLGEGWSHAFRGGVLSMPPLIPQLPIAYLNRSHRRTSIKKWPPPGRRPSPKLQQPISRLLLNPIREQPRASARITFLQPGSTLQ